MFGRDKSREKQQEFTAVQGETVEVQNVYEILPPDGTIIGVATEEEMEMAAELEAEHYAYSRLMESAVQLDASSHKELLKEFMEHEKKSMKFYRGLHKRLAAPWAWTLRVDVANGPVIVSNEHLLYDAEEIEEEEEN